MNDERVTVLLVRHAEPVRPGQGNFAENEPPAHRARPSRCGRIGREPRSKPR